MVILQSEKDQEILKEYISKIDNPNCYLEIGTLNGGSALLAKEITDRPIYSIDIENKLTDELLCNPKFNFILGDSLDIVKLWNKPIGLLFIDGNHLQAGKDFEAFKDKVIKGGYILFHDYCSHPDWTVVEDCDEIMEKYKNKYEIVFKPSEGCGTSILVLKKL